MPSQRPALPVIEVQSDAGLAKKLDADCTSVVVGMV
jgi:hypothetical protein